MRPGSNLRRIEGCVLEAGNGKHVILLFQEDDDYNQYVSYFHRDGTHPTSGGCLIHKDYVHIAVPYEPSALRRVLAHELTHNCVVHLRLPLWLNEGLAKMFEHTGCRWSRSGFGLRLERAAPGVLEPGDHPGILGWNPIRKPGDSNELSYSLAQIILTLLLEKPGDCGSFLKEAQWGDAGQTAAMYWLETDLGDVMGTFLAKATGVPAASDGNAVGSKQESSVASTLAFSVQPLAFSFRPFPAPQSAICHLQSPNSYFRSVKFL